jgi:MscS family membrane protein
VKGFRFIRAFLLGIFCVLLLSGLPSLADLQQANSRSLDAKYESEYPVIPIQQQPFYEDLRGRADVWLHTPLGQVVGNNPRDTLLNFYAVMADVGIVVDDLTASHLNDPGWFWDQQTLAEMDEAEELFSAAVQALDGSLFAKAVRPYLKEEAAIQLKHVLDYVFHNSRETFSIPDASDIKEINDGRSKETQSWTLPGTSITLTSHLEEDPQNSDYYFSAETVAAAAQMYEHVRAPAEALSGQPFVTASFYQDFIHTPGHLFPPKWYLMMPSSLRGSLETELFLGETVFQVLLSIVSISIFVLISLRLLKSLVNSYRLQSLESDQSSSIWTLDTIAWQRVLVVLPLLPLSKLTEWFIDEYLNFTGTPLVVFTILFEIIFFSVFILFVFLFFEALGRSASESLVTFSGSHESWRLLRTSNRVMPLCRITAGVIAILLIYSMLLQLGLSPTLVLALSTVPGLAIGLGASKLLGNLFAGLSLQTDRPLRVGEFCGIGDDLGFITRIGLRSVELQTASGMITIPNAVAEDCVVNNFSRHQASMASGQNSIHSQGLELRIGLDQDQPFSPDQVTDLLDLARDFLAANPEFQSPCVTAEVQNNGQPLLVCIGLITVENWTDYLALKESLLIRLQQLIDQVSRSHFVLPVSYDTSAKQLASIPSIIREIVSRNPGFSLRACRLMQISEFSYDFKCHLFATGLSYHVFKDSIDQINQDIIVALAAQEIVIPYPTAIEIQRDD